MRIPNIKKIRDVRFSESDYQCERYEEYPYNDEGYDVSTEKNKIAFVKYVEKLIRTSYEYKKFITFLKENLKMNSDSYFHKVDTSIKGISVEIHHTPFTLYDLCLIYVEKLCDNGIELNPFLITELVLKEHFSGNVGLIPLVKTTHELVHAGQIFIPLSATFGDIGEFYKENYKYMTPTMKDYLTKLINLSKDIENCEPVVLQKKFTYLDITR